MEQQQHSRKFLRQRKFFTVLPLLVFPFLTLIFWALGGGKGNGAMAQSKRQTGFNIELPGANLKNDRGLDKLSYYEKAEKDSARFRDLMKNDPYYNKQITGDSALLNDFDDTAISNSQGNYSHYLSRDKNVRNSSAYIGTSTDENEQKVYRKLGELNTALDNAATVSKPRVNDYTATNHYSGAAVDGGDIDRLENMMQAMKGGNAQDTEMNQLSGMMDKILDMQHPERVSQRLKEQSELHRQQVFPVMKNNGEENISLLGSNQHLQRDSTPLASKILSAPYTNAFYALGDNNTVDDEQNSIEAVVHETQILVSGSTVKLRLLSDVYINGLLIPKGGFVFGTASLTGERLTIDIATIRFKNNILPVALSVYDLDGLQGIYIPGAISRDVAKQSADQSIQSFGGITSLNPSLGAQAASAGIETAKTLLSKKVKLVKVTVKAGYQVLLRDNKQKDQ